MGSEKPIDAAQIKMEAAVPSKLDDSCSSSSKKACILSLVGFIFVLLNLAALWALHFADRPVTNFNTDGVLRNGAGTTGYLNKLTVGVGLKGVSYINFAPMGTTNAYYTTNVISYLRTTDTATESVVTTITYDTTGKNLTQADIDTTNNVLTGTVRGLATLSDTQMAVLVVGTTVAVAPATLDATGKVTVAKSKAKDVTTSSPTNLMGALSSSAFVVAYYDPYNSAAPYPYSQRVKVGTMATDGTITMSAAVAFGGSNDADAMYNFGSPLALKALATATTAGFVIPYYDVVNAYSGTSTKTTATLNGLCVTSSSVSAGTVATFTTPVCNSAYRPGFLIESVALSSSAMAIVFHDKSNNNALTVAVVTVNPTDSSLHFRSSYVFKEVSGDFDWYKAKYGGYSPTPRLRVLSGNRLVVSFLNPTLAGRLSVRVLGFSVSTLAFHDLTPVLPVAPSTFTLAVSSATNTYGAITHDTIPVGDDGFVTAYVGNRDNTVHQNFAVVETFGNPVGVMQSTSSDSTSVTMQGTAEISGLMAGKMHYAMTSGDVVAPDTTSTNSNSAEFFYTSSDAVIITTDSRVGMAVDDDTLFVATSF
ncbi:hypothetical protein BBO99_00001978 [Phytophthora kernoviae]|uniref:Uncharacterized protein n=1 Tax=Phytophthora kernoviae TaxID=325452 RepID=A0A3R7JAK9_9STRA|nr:hypothetical protein JM16_001659 [Phytophthora kernoviae]RLN20247.1 hypothetical protein BBI17_001972 [Phytophthora kernoviae]RLN83585.1 hypothetical protein BBO99_00001978 [Phytophthora kernoviae]